MSKDVINVDGQDVVVEETTAKAYRGVNWAIVSMSAFIAIATAMFIVFSMVGASDGEVQTPAEIEKR